MAETLPDTCALTVAETAELLNVDVKTVRDLFARGEIKGARFGPKIIRIHRDSVLKKLMDYHGEIQQFIGGNSKCVCCNDANPDLYENTNVWEVAND